MNKKRVMSFDLEIILDEDNDSIEVLADALGGDFERTAKLLHEVDVECTRIRIDGKELSL